MPSHVRRLQYILYAIIHMMKTKITLTMDPEIVRRAKKLAHARKTNVSALLEGLVRGAPLPGEKERRPFAQRWAGRFRVAPTDPNDARLAALKARYQLSDK